ncbi:MAG: hypothetical protein Q8M29_03110 [Bacteroidota bacterium]|nr:hypothetical protein [Bacteroidota bacterium]
MEKHKFDNYYKDFESDLEVKPLDRLNSKKIFNQFYDQINHKIGKENFFKDISESITEKISIIDINDRIGFNNIIKKIDNVTFYNTEKCFLIWDSETGIDQCDFSLLTKYWDYIWYGPSDESMIVFIPGKLILLVSDWGEIKVKKL